MKYKIWHNISLVACGALLALAFNGVGLVGAQTGPRGEGQAALAESAPPAVTNPSANRDDDDPPPTGPAAVSIVNDVIQVQGRLTDAAGTPITGSQSVTVAIYDTPSGGVARCTDTDAVLADRGLFTMNMDFCTAADFNGDQLYMGIAVDADPEMTPRQPIFAVPYAWGLRPGAIVKGADSYVFVPGDVLIKNQSSDTTRWDIQTNGGARIWGGGAAGNKTVYFPITLPAVLYGQNVTLEQITIYYKVSNGANAYITSTTLNLQTDACCSVNIINSPTDRTSTAPASYTLNLASHNVLSSSQGALGLYLIMSFANNTDYIDLAAIRLRLSHQ